MWACKCEEVYCECVCVSEGMPELVGVCELCATSDRV